jgi:prolyl-tRNA editing enzyme YbaK/EbsC (Cys-tRNA(Pro) deacylase)
MIPEKVRSVLEAHGLSVLAAQQLGVAVGQIAKSLLFAGKNGAFFMVVCPGDRRLSASKLKAAMGVKSRMASVDEALSATGFGPGGVCPFGIDPGIRVFLDKSLSAYETVFPAAGTDSSGVPMTFDQLVSVTGGTVGDYLNDAEEGRPAEHGGVSRAPQGEE